MSYGKRVVFETLREVAFGAVTASFAAWGAVLAHNVRIISINNGTNADIYVSFDGTNAHIRVAANSFQLFDFTSNMVTHDDDAFFLANRTQVYIKYVTAPTSGTAWLEVVGSNTSGA